MTQSGSTIDKYPWSKIIPRWILGAAEIGIGVYLVTKYNMNLGLLFTAYVVLSLFVLLPMLRCSSCYYYGKRCNTAWGLFAEFAFEKTDTKFFQSGYVLTIILWPMRLIPLGIGLIRSLGEVRFEPHGLVLIYIGLIVLHRLYYRAVNCRVCHQKTVCPVYDPHILK